MLLNSKHCTVCKEPIGKPYGYRPNFDHSFFGGRISMTAEYKCTNCDNLYKLYLEDDKRGGYNLVAIELKPKNEPVLSQEPKHLEPQVVDDTEKEKVVEEVKKPTKPITVKTKIVSSNSKAKKK